MIRINILVEGDTEETFVRDVLSAYMNRNEHIYTITPSKVITSKSKKRGTVHKGGGSSFALIKNHLLNWMKSDTKAYYTTMFDLYAFPSDIPNYNSLKSISNPIEKVCSIEGLFSSQINSWRFIPYIQLHEFEALIFTNPLKMKVFFVEHKYDSGINELKDISLQYSSPEYINEGLDTAPSKRIVRCLEEYRSLKSVAGPQIVENIGIDSIRQKCEHFNHWIETLEKICV